MLFDRRQFQLASREAVAPLGSIRPEIEIVTTSDGLELRCALFSPPGRSFGVVEFWPGKSGIIGECQPLANVCVREGLDVVVTEHRGQGGSGREVARRQKVHIPSFDLYRQDAEEVRTQIINPHRGNKPRIILAHSMSSAIFLPKLQGDDNSYTDGFVGMAPMVEAWKLPLEGRLANFYKGLAWLMTSVGAGKSYVPKGGQHHCKDFDFETNPYTNDRDTFDRWHELMGKVPHFLTRGPTYGWVQAYYENAELLKSMPDNSIKVPTKVFLASDDTIVRNETAVPFLNRVYAPDCLSIEEIRGTKHGLDQGGPEVWSKIVDGINELVNNAYVPLTRHREKCMALAAD